MGGARLLACLAIIGAVSGQQCPLDCGTRGACAQYSDGQFYCDCNGSTCGDVVCRLMTQATNVPFCKLNVAGNCTGDLTNGRLCSCPPGRSGVLCELEAPATPLTLCQRREMLNTFILGLLRDSVPMSGTLEFVRQVTTPSQLMALLQYIGIKQVVRYECDAEGRFRSTQCEVDVVSGVEQCYCVNQDSGKIKTGHSKMAARPSDCTAHATNSCEMKPDTGNCDMVHPRWFFNMTSSKCEMFTYGGCYGNKNNFQTVNECYNTCANYAYPCAAVTCMVGTICTVVPDNTQCRVGKCAHSASCRVSGEKLGQCPNTAGMVGTCVEYCSSDTACPNEQKCCSNGCGHSCMPPVQPPPVEKPGQCPNTTGMMGICVESCSADTACPGEQKCCSNGCGHSCMPPVQPPPVEKPGQCPNTTGMMGICVESCSADTACPDEQKCCSNGCGHSCMPPVQPPPVEKPGQCPNTTGMMGICVESCSADTACPGEQKCCSNGCGHVCMQPAHVPPVVKPGQCMPRPMPPPGGQCIDRMDQCGHDGECDGNYKCCMGDCEMMCMPPGAPSQVPAECKVPPTQGGVMCVAYIPRFFYNTSTAQCETFIYGGCRGTTNMFLSAQQCYHFCNENKNPCKTKNVQCGAGSNCYLNSTFIEHLQRHSVTEYCAGPTYQVAKSLRLAIEWLNTYSDPNHMEAKSITRALRSALTAKYTGLPYLLDLVMGQIQPGSVVAPYTLEFSQRLSADDSSTLETIATEIQEGGLQVLGVHYQSAEATQCVIPDEYTGMWYSVHENNNMETMVYADRWTQYPCQKIHFENKPLGSKEVNSTLILNKSNNCFVCMKVVYQTPNILQIQEGSCFGSNIGMEYMCQGIEQQPLQTLFKNNFVSQECEIEGFYQYKYETKALQGAVCDHKNNTIAVTTRDSFNINFTDCFQLPSAVPPNMSFTCLGSWYGEAGGTRYKFAAVLNKNTALPNHQRYNCMMTLENQLPDRERWVMSQFATCASLTDLYTAPISLVLSKQEPPVKPGYCPARTPADSWCFDSCTMDPSCTGSKKCCGGCCKEPTTGPITVPETCKVSPHPPANSFGCFAYIPRWFYNETTSRCEKYIFGGCPRSTNDFGSPQECYSACNKTGSPCQTTSCAADSKCRVEESDNCPDQGPCHNLITNCYPSHCSMEPETGPCRALMPSWFFNTTSNSCQKFIYGGCQGNNNKFPSAHACYNECAPRVNPCRNYNCPTGQQCVVKEQVNCTRGACSTIPSCKSSITVPETCKVSPHPPANSFGCFAYIPRWFYNDTTSRCEKYIFGGCPRSTNDFGSPQECYSACNKAESPCRTTSCAADSKCRVEESDNCPAEGPCHNLITNCYPSHCSMEPETGPCRALMPSWFFNTTSNSCQKFIYGGCQGNNNKFPSAHACYNECAPRVNPCRNYNCPTGQLCVVKEQVNCTRGACSAFPKCENVTRPGECPAYDPMMQVDVSGGCSNTCSVDIDCHGHMKCCFHGCSKKCLNPEEPVNPCSGGRMMCRSVKKCVSLSVKCDGTDDCGDGSDELNCPGPLPGKCYKPPLPPPGSTVCEGYFPRWFYNSTTSQCEEYIWGGCHPSENHFDTASQCRRECSITVPETCKVSPHPPANSFGCFAYIPRWFYNDTTSRCEKYIFGGCPRSTNDFGSPQECYSACNKAESPCRTTSCAADSKCRVEESDNCPAEGPCHNLITNCYPSHCSMEPETGPCRALMPSWFFNTTSNSCQKFIYGGCQGNNNRFPSAHACYNECAPRVNPCRNYNCQTGRCVVNEQANCTRGACSTFARCEIATSCTAHHHCAHGGTCWEGRCICAPGYYGSSCQQQRDPCASSPCLNGGTCKTPYNHDNYTCSCPPNTSGQRCQEHVELAECRNLYLTNTNAFTDTITHCMNILILINNSAIATSDLCSVYGSVLKCGIDVMRSHGVGCSYLDLHKELAAFASQLANADMPSGMGYTAVSTCTGSVPTGNDTAASLCGDGRLMATVATATMCVSAGMPGCVMLSGSVGCLKMYTKCSASFIRNSLITHASILINSHNTDFSGCERPSGMIYKYEDSVRLNMPWTNDLYASSTLLYKSLKTALENSLEAGFIAVGDVEHIAVTSFSPGSVRASWTGEFIFPLTETKRSLIQQTLTTLVGTEVYVNGNPYTFMTTAAVKPGECPMVTNSTMNVCSGADCTSDTDCSGVMKCCYNSCGSTCQYPTNTTGGTCTSRYDCYNGGTCYQGMCMCAPGYYGTNCRHQRDPCASMPCQNNGSCLTPYHHDNYTCDCPPNIRGQRCEVRVCDLFARDMCQGASSFCRGNLNEGDVCWCESGRTGLFCEQQGPDHKWGCEKLAEYADYIQQVLNGQVYPPLNYSVVSNPVDFLDKANLTTITIPTCSETNPAHYTSPSCDMDIATRQKTCYCVDRFGDEIRGTRKPSYMGPPDCRDPCEKLECLNGAVCYLRNDSTVGYCRCPQGYSGNRCQFVGDACQSSPCANGFACEINYDGGYRCNCSAEWGPNCSIVPPQYCNCSPWQRCVWYERCYSGGCQDLHKCVGYDYSGPCDRGMPCGWNGKCVERGYQEYKCLCDEGYSGAHCKVNELVCRELGPLRYRLCGLGRCVGDVERGELCSCPPGRKGAFCELEGDAASLCERQSHLYHTAMEVMNGTRTVPGLQNASSVVMQITKNVLGLSEVPLVTCTPTGDFTPQQCAVDLYSYSERCYCVDNAGEEIYQNITVLPGQPSCTAPGPKDIGKLLCESQEEGVLCLNGGTCIGDMDGTPQLCACSYGYEGVMCERRTQPGDYPEQYTMCTFTLDMYHLMMSMKNGSINLQMQGVTIDKQLLMYAYHQMIMAATMHGPQPIAPPPGNMSQAMNSTIMVEKSLLMPNCTADGHYHSLQCEYGMESGARQVCYCFSESGRMIPGTRTMPPYYPKCDNVTDVCEPMPCALDCPMGFRKNMLGCDLCQCKELCDGKMCPHGTRCHDSGECRPTHKKGMCPVEMMPTLDSLQRMFEDTMDSCDMTCRDDADCDGAYKCCGTCGNRCVQPYIPAYCEEKRRAMDVHWNLHQNLTAMLEERNMEQSMSNYSFPAVLHSAIQWVHNTRIMWRPACDSDGEYERVQCMFDVRSGNKDHCFCSDNEGRRINGTDRRPPMQPLCSEKPGFCLMELMSPTPTSCSSECQNDYNCSGHDKCCRKGCNSVCQSPVNDTIVDHNEMVAEIFSGLCTMMTDVQVCYQGSECVSDWHAATLCDCPPGYKGALCQEMMAENEKAPSLCERRRAIFETITDPEFLNYKTMVLGTMQLDTVVMNWANCSGEGFTPTQCDYDINNNSKKWCYCVNETGHPIPGTRVSGDVMPQCGDMKCDAGHRLYRPDNHDSMRCDKRQHCPSGYECKEVAYGHSVCCISSEGHQDICRLAASPGKWCDGDYGSWQIRYTFNATLGRCMPFRFRGCHGNKNTFKNENDCQKMCVKKDKEGTCPKPSPSLTSRYCHNSCEDDSKCLEDKKCCDTGCGRKCVMPKREDSDRVCKLGVQYTSENGSNFYCGRGQAMCPEGYTCNVDPLDRPSFCCPDEDKPVNVCHQPKQTGPCKASMPRYFFNRMTNQCEKFIYGGCQGNDNNFESLEECCLRCGSEDDQCKPGTCPNPTKNYLLPCQDTCESDKTCLGNTRCCYNGCGKECILPLMNKTTNCHSKLKEAHMMLQNFKKEEKCPMIVIPRCHKDGTWQSQQCLDGFGICWCVDAQGHKMADSMVRGHANCPKYLTAPINVALSMENDTEFRNFQVCPQDTGINCCHPSLCQLHTCRAHPSAVCRVNPCNGCHVEFRDKDNNVVNCMEGLSKCELKLHRAKTSRTQNLFNQMPEFTDRLGNFSERVMDKMMPKPEKPAVIPAMCQRMPGDMCNDGLEVKWFYNHETNRCEKFGYSGCPDNLNYFPTAGECYQTCNPAADPCQMSDCGEGRECHLAVDPECFVGKCAHWAQCRYVADGPHLSGVVLPTCSPEGFAPKQCHHGYCWCVNRDGTPQDDKLALMHGLTCSYDGTNSVEDGTKLECSSSSPPNLRCVNECLEQVCRGRPHAVCVVDLCSDSCEVKFMEDGQEVQCKTEETCEVMYADPPPKCTEKPLFCEEGAFPKLCADKCKAATCPGNPCAVCRMDQCTCLPVFEDMLTREPVTDCKKVTHTRCEMSKCWRMKERNTEMLLSGESTVVVPTCTASGHYEAQQCDSERCWCVDGLGSFLGSSSPDDWCRWNETVKVEIKGIKFSKPYNLIEGKEKLFIRAVKSAVKSHTGVPDGDKFITVVRVYPGSIMVDMVLEGERDSDVPPPEVPIMADIIHRKIAEGELTVEFEDQEYTAESESETYTRTDRFEQAPISVTPKPPHPEPEPGLQQHEVIIIAVVSSIAGVVLLGILIKCCCCRRDQKELPVHQSPPPQYVNSEKPYPPPNMGVSNATYGMINAPFDNLAYHSETDIIKQPITDNLDDGGEFIKVRL